METIPDSTISSALAGLLPQSRDDMQIDQSRNGSATSEVPHKLADTDRGLLQQTPSEQAIANAEERSASNHAEQAHSVSGHRLGGIYSDQQYDIAGQEHSNHTLASLPTPEFGGMPPPAAPASMLYTIRASDTAKKGAEQNSDPFICSHLAAVAVTLFRMGKAKESKAVGQFAVNLLGEERWHEWLLKYMNEPEEDDAEKWALPLLSDVATALRVEDPSSSGFLSILVELME